MALSFTEIRDEISSGYMVNVVYAVSKEWWDDYFAAYVISPLNNNFDQPVANERLLYDPSRLGISSVRSTTRRTRLESASLGLVT